jgi:hypothetical protein
VGIFAALHLVMSLLPLFVLTGGGGFISLGLVSAVVIGFISGPFYGPVSVLIGSTLGVAFLNIGGILGFFIPVLAPTSSAFVTGCLRSGRYLEVAIVYAIGIAAFLLGPIGSVAYPYLWLHVIALLLVLSLFIPGVGRVFLNGLRFDDEKPELTFLAAALLSFVGLMADHLIGGATAAYHFIYLLGWDPVATADFYLLVALTYALERLSVTLVLAGVIAALTNTLQRLQVPVDWVSEGEVEVDS